MATQRDAAPMRRAVGLMSGTSLDGIDVALLSTDGRRRVAPGAALTVPYDASLRDALRGVLGAEQPSDRVDAVERRLTDAHAEAVRTLLRAAGFAAADIDVVGFHGHTILHRPDRGRTWQIGDGARLAAALGIDVVGDFRSADVAAGGEGAPLAPAYHAALAAGLPQPLCVLNIGGVANVTLIGAGDLLAFDTGPGNALLDEWVERATGARYDTDGALARAGRMDRAVLARLMADPYFDRPPPKSLDRLDFDLEPLVGLSPADGAATLVGFTCEAVARARALLPARPARWLVTGGGRRNPAIMDGLRARLDAPVDPVEAVGWQGDALEAQAFAFLAVRCLDGLPISFPGATGVAAPLTGGRLFRGR